MFLWREVCQPAAQGSVVQALVRPLPSDASHPPEAWGLRASKCSRVRAATMVPSGLHA